MTVLWLRRYSVKSKEDSQTITPPLPPTHYQPTLVSGHPPTDKYPISQLKPNNLILKSFLKDKKLTGSLLAASASSSQASSTGLRAIMLLWDNVNDSNLTKLRYNSQLTYQTQQM